MYVCMYACMYDPRPETLDPNVYVYVYVYVSVHITVRPSATLGSTRQVVGGEWYPPAERSSAAFNDEVNPRIVFDQWFQDSQACRVGLKELEQIGAKTMVSRQAGRER